MPQAIALNIANMVGIGPFITIPGFIAAMHGPQALIAWVIAAVLVICDGLVWSELGAALPGSGGTYHFLREIFGKSDSSPICGSPSCSWASAKSTGRLRLCLRRWSMARFMTIR